MSPMQIDRRRVASAAPAQGPRISARLQFAYALLWLLLACLISGTANAAARASVQPERITLGNTATLTIETDESGVQPDLSPLQEKFELRGQSSSMQTSIVNGRQSTRIAYTIEIEPREAGIVGIPPLQVGQTQTESLSLTVMPPTPGSPASGDPYFVQTELSADHAYVQQPLVYTVRLYYAVQLVDGNVEARTPEHASLQQLGEDINRQEEVGGRRYQVFERHYLLIPEQSGPLTIPPAQFRGRAQSDGRRGYFGGVENVSAVSQPRSIEVRPQPDGAPQPWLPARSLALARGQLPAGARAGEPLMLEISLTADGVTKDQLPEIKLPAIADAQVFPEPAQTQDSLVAGLPVSRRTQRFAIVPAHAGPLTLPALEIGYWNTANDRADVARLDALTLQIAAGNPSVPAAAAPVIAPIAASAPAAIAPTASDPELLASLRNWRIAAGVLLAALIVALLWGWRRGASAAPSVPALSPTRAALLPQALQTDDLKVIAAALCADGECLSLGALATQLGDATQRNATQALDTALWAGAGQGDTHALLAQLRAAFKSGLRMAPASTGSSVDTLPPLYPVR